MFGGRAEDLAEKQAEAEYATAISEVNVELLEAARAGRNQKIQLAIAILRRKGRVDRYVLFAPEEGDGEGLRYVRQFAEDVRQQALLRPGESLEIELWTAAFKTVVDSR